MKIIITGANGQLGRDVSEELQKRGHDVIGTDLFPRGENGSRIQFIRMDITDAAEAEQVIRRLDPDAVIHCAAWTDVDGAEDPANREQVRRINACGTANIAKAARAAGASMLYISTDYVFDGKGTRPWHPDDDCPAPLNYYGETKLEGEMAVRDALDRFFIVRISWLFGVHGNNFVKTMIRAGRTHDQVSVVNDQVGSPTYTRHLAVLISDMIVTDKYGIYHASNEGEYISWYDFACEIYNAAGMDVTVLPVTTQEYGRSAAARPENSRMDKSKLRQAGFTLLPDWRKALKEFMEEYKKEGSL